MPISSQIEIVFSPDIKLFTKENSPVFLKNRVLTIYAPVLYERIQFYDRMMLYTAVSHLDRLPYCKTHLPDAYKGSLLEKVFQLKFNQNRNRISIMSRNFEKYTASLGGALWNPGSFFFDDNIRIYFDGVAYLVKFCDWLDNTLHDTYYIDLTILDGAIENGGHGPIFKFSWATRGIVVKNEDDAKLLNHVLAGDILPL